MSLQQQNARITEAPRDGWVIWLSEDAMALVEELLKSVTDNPEASMDEKKIAEDILEGIY